MQFAHGILVAGYLTIALIFLRYWRRSADRLFLCFSISFALMAVHRSLLAAMDVRSDVGTWVYWLRLLSYLIIIYAIVEKNMRKARD